MRTPLGVPDSTVKAPRSAFKGPPTYTVVNQKVNLLSMSEEIEGQACDFCDSRSTQSKD